MIFPFTIAKTHREVATVSSGGGTSVTISAANTVLATFVVPQSQVWEVVEIQAEGSVADRIQLRSKTSSTDASPVVIEHWSHGANGTNKDVITTPQRIQLTGINDATANNRARWELVNLTATSGTASAVIVCRKVS